MDKTPNRLRKLSCKKSQDTADDDTETIVISPTGVSFCPTSTPIKTTVDELENEDSFPMSGLTQDYNDDIGVTWDWNSPQARLKEKRKPAVFTKRFSPRVTRLSPKITIKRHPSSENQQQKFEKLREEFLELRRQIAIPDNESSLILSPQEEASFRKEAEGESALDSLIEDEKFNGEQDFEDIFNDSLDEQLVLCTQQVESVLACDNKNQNIVDMKSNAETISLVPQISNTSCSSSSRNVFTVSNNSNGNNYKTLQCRVSSSANLLQNSTASCANSTTNAFIVGNNSNDRDQSSSQCKVNSTASSLQHSNTKYSNSVKNPTNENADSNDKNHNMLKCKVEVDDKLDDSFDVVFAAFQDEDIERLTQTYDKTKDTDSSKSFKTNTIKRTQSDMQVKVMQTRIKNGKTEFGRTQSFEASDMARREGYIPPDKLQEIERKRQEALAKLEAKRKQGANVSPFHCSPDEIEKKRLQAVAKLAKKQEQEIERKRMEALKRLELTKMKMKKGGIGNNNLVKRLN